MIEKEKVIIERQIVPICSHCKKTRNEEGSWETVSRDLYKDRKVDLSHSVCPECRVKFYKGI